MTGLAIAALLILSGLFVLGVATLGIFRFSTMLNRIHVAAKCDTLGALLVLAGLMVLAGWSVLSLKLLLAIVFLWLSNPVASHLVARAEVRTCRNLEELCDFLELDGDGELVPLAPEELRSEEKGER
ncbi:MAG: monovalent cation/H(+) antiporter subunit G [Fretibacterium sp.]|nr:monovalent cation/H(+) antiporter subunit G [Fretibacterium sp.]